MKQRTQRARHHNDYDFVNTSQVVIIKLDLIEPNQCLWRQGKSIINISTHIITQLLWLQIMALFSVWLGFNCRVNLGHYVEKIKSFLNVDYTIKQNMCFIFNALAYLTQLFTIIYVLSGMSPSLYWKIVPAGLQYCNLLFQSMFNFIL